MVLEHWKPGEIKLLQDRGTGLSYSVEIVSIGPRPYNHGEFNAVIRVPGTEKTAKVRLENLERVKP